MYERFTDRARKVMVLANKEAQRFNHEYIATEHILLGLIKEGSGVAANVLKNFDVDWRRIRLEVEKVILSAPVAVTVGKRPQTPRAKQVIEYAMEEARNLGHNYVGTEHMLLGLMREQVGVAAQVLMSCGLKLDRARDEVLAILGHGSLGLSDQANRFKVEETRKMLAKAPAVCPKCGQVRVVRVLWRWVHVSGQNEEDVRSGKAILGTRHGMAGPPWVCLDCVPAWSEVHRMAMQDWHWELAKVEAVASQDFEKAVWYRDQQRELNERLSAVVKELLKDQ